MSTANKKKIRPLDVHVFKPEPPSDPRTVKRLFSGRQRELRRGINALKGGIDLDGKRSKQLDKYPWVIHGESRSGKSHLARMIFAEFPDNDRRLQFCIGASGRLDATAVMRDLFEQMRGSFLNRLHDQTLSSSPLLLARVRLAIGLVEKLALFQPGIQSASLTYEETDGSVLEAGGEIGGILGKFVAKFQTQHSEKSGIQVALRSPTADDLAEICGIMTETLLEQKLVRHVLVLMDDVDLLETYVSERQNARFQRSLLADAIRTLHKAPGLDVVLTARSWYAHSQKELQTLVDLAQATLMSVEEIVEVHDRRLKVYGHKGGVSFLTDEAIRQLAGDVDGLPGVFLQHLHTALYKYTDGDVVGPQSYDWLLSFYREHLTSLQYKCASGYKALQEAVEAGRLTVDISGSNPFYGTVLDNEYAYQSYYSEQTYFVSGLLRKLLTPPGGTKL